MKKILIIIGSVLLTSAFIFLIVWGCINFSKVKKGLAGSGIYNQEDLNAWYDNGYSDALKNKEEYETLINGYRDTITTLNDQVSQLNSQVTILTNGNKEYALQVTNLQSQITELNENIRELNIIKTNSEETITTLNTQVKSLQSEITSLTETGEDNSAEIARLKNQVKSLQGVITQLEETNSSNVNTINNLNNQIVKLNENISNIISQSESNSNTIQTLNSRINQLETSVDYYKQLLQAYETTGKVIATFKIDEQIYNVQVVASGTSVSVTTPTSTQYLIFNGWSVDGVTAVDLSTVVLTDNVTFTALLTKKYDVKFNYENTLYNSQIIQKGHFAENVIPTNTDYKEFIGWSLDGNTIIDVSTYEITKATTFYAVFNYSYDVKFLVDNEIFETKIIKSGNFATATVPTKTGYIFEGWTIDGTNLIDLSTKTITSETIFVAKFKVALTVTFMLDDEIFDTKYVDNDSYVLQENIPTKSGYEFDGWSIDGINIINLETKKITADTTLTAKFSKLLSVKFMLDDEEYNTQSVKTNGNATTPTVPTKDGYIFKGWYSGDKNFTSLLNTDCISNINNIVINKDTIFKAIFVYNFSGTYNVFMFDRSTPETKYLAFSFVINNDRLISTTSNIPANSFIVDSKIGQNSKFSLSNFVFYSSYIYYCVDYQYKRKLSENFSTQTIYILFNTIDLTVTLDFNQSYAYHNSIEKI